MQSNTFNIFLNNLYVCMLNDEDYLQSNLFRIEFFVIK
jgi:hypothetical protein